MNNIFTCAQRYQVIRSTKAEYFPCYAVPSLYYHQQSEMFPYIEFTRMRTIPTLWVDALMWVYHKVNEGYTMSGKKLPKKSSTNGFGIEFINYRLDGDERVDYLAWRKETNPDFERILLDMLAAEIKVGFSIDAQRSTFICSITPRGERDKNIDKCLVSRSDEFDDALFLNLFKMQLFESRNKGLWASRDDDETWG